jgi:predicted HicB family RNase H-like nuclease
MKDDIRNISIRVEPELFKRLKIHCATYDITMNDYIKSLIQINLIQEMKYKEINLG